MEKADARRARELFLNQAVATIVIFALIIWVLVLFRSYFIVGILLLLVIIIYSVFVPKNKFKR